MALKEIDWRNKFADIYANDDVELVFRNGGDNTQAHWLIDDLPASAGDSPFVAAFQQFAEAIEDLIAFFQQPLSNLSDAGTVPDDLRSDPFNGIADPADDFISVAAAPLQAEKTPFPFTVGLEDFHGVPM
jgi:hypothetical protein